MSINPAHAVTAIDAELAYRREQVILHFRPWRRVGTERTVAHTPLPRHAGPARTRDPQ